MAVASSSACSASNSYSGCHDVFISHRGPDIKETFATALYRKLDHHGVRAFLDKSEMQVGQNITSQLEDAIRGASVHVALFTENYARSTWCLDELLLMVESNKSGRRILPVFHGVKPADLRRTDKDNDGPYALALRKLEEKRGHGIQKVQNWRNALSYVADISGLELANFKGGEFELLHEVVQRVVEMVPKPPLRVAKHPTGLQQKVAEFERHVRLAGRQKDEQACKVVGIVGSGGVGKTTLAKQFFNANRSIYSGSSFLFDVAKKALPSSQRKLIKDLKGIDIEIQSSVEGLGQLERNLSDFDSIIVLDDIDNVDQLDAFLPIKNVLDHKSLLLVTTRDMQVLRNADIEEEFIYHLKELNTEDSRKLFCCHAFSKPHPPPEFNDVIDGFLNTCGGLPLSLKVLGASLRGKNSISYWQELLNGLGLILPEDIQKNLRVSYDSLNEQEKQIFLDIACFCVGEESDKWIKVWSGSGWQGSVALQTLQDKCLVELDTEKENIIRMHDLLVLMGRNIAQQRSLPIRIWCGTFREIFDLLEQSLYETIEVRGIRMATPSNIARDTDHAEESLKLEELLNSKEVFRIKKLQILEGEGDFVEKMLKLKVLSRNLISLRWNDCRCSCLPSFSMQDLRVLEVNGRELGRLWPEDEYRAPQQLLQLNIDAPLLEFPKSLGKLRHLEKIVVKSARLRRMPDPLWDLIDLQHIALVGCENLDMLPDSLGNLTNLRYLNLSLCKSLRVLPDSMEKLKKLEFINLDSCRKLEKLPHCLLNFPKICCTPAIIYEDHYGYGLDIDLSAFPCLKMLPDSLLRYMYADRLRLNGCESLKSLPDFLGELTRLNYIDLRMCKSLEMLPDSFENLTPLYSINLSGCESLKRLPDSLGKLTSLTSINLELCKSLEMLPDSFENLTSLYCIILSGCESLKRLPDSLGKLTSLRSINLGLCKSLEMLPSFGNLISLEAIDLNGCESLKRLPDSLGKLTSLTSINLELCKSLEMLPDSFENLTSLYYINLSRCESLKRLPDSLGKLTSLRAINLGLCKSLEMLPSFGNLTSLETIDLFGCENLKRLPDSLGKLTSLTFINLELCKSLEMLPDSFENLIFLYYINLSGCESLKRLPDSLGKLTSLKYINLGLCKSLKMLPDSFENLKDLYGVDLSGWKHLERLPNSWASPQLQHLHLKGCSSLTMSTKTLGNLSGVKCLDLSSCPQIELLPPEVGRQLSLKKLNLFDTNLKEFAFDVESFKNLEVLRLGSPLLEALPASLASFANLQELWLHGCVQLQCLPDSIALLTQLTELNIRKCGIQSLPPGIMKMNKLRTLAVHRCPLRELPFGKIEGEKGMLGLNVLQLNGTEISEISFPEGVCPDLQHLSITFCNDLVEVRALPTTLISLSLDLKGCRALMKTGGLCGLSNLKTLNLNGCDNLQTDALPGLQAIIPSNCTLLNTQMDTSDGKEDDALLKVFCHYF